MKNGITLEEWVEVICPVVPPLGKTFEAICTTVGSRRLFLIICTNVSSTGLSDPAPAWVMQHPPVHHPKNPVLGFHGWGRRARVNQQPSMHQLAVLSTGWAAFFHSAPDAIYHSLFCFIFWFLTVFSLNLTSHITTLHPFLFS